LLDSFFLVKVLETVGQFPVESSSPIVISEILIGMGSILLITGKYLLAPVAFLSVAVSLPISGSVVVSSVFSLAFASLVPDSKIRYEKAVLDYPFQYKVFIVGAGSVRL